MEIEYQCYLFFNGIFEVGIICWFYSNFNCNEEDTI